MAFILLLLGIIIVITGYEGTFSQFMALLGQDMPGFLVWAGAIALIGAIGYIPDFAGVSNALLALVLIVIVIADKGAFANFQALLKSPPQPAGVQQLTSAADQAALAQGPTINIGFAGGSAPSSSGGGLFGGTPFGGIASWFGL